MEWKEFVERVGDFEGFSPTPYKCPAGVWTIGFGRTDGVNANTPEVKKDDELMYLDRELNRLSDYIYETYMSLGLLEYQIWALSSFTYNCGKGNLKKLVDGRNKNQIGDALLLYNKANGKTLQGLIRRRQWEHDLYIAKFSSQLVSRKSVIGYKIDGRWWTFANKTLNINGVDSAFMAEIKVIDGVIKVDMIEDGFMVVPEHDIISGKFAVQFFGV